MQSLRYLTEPLTSPKGEKTFLTCNACLSVFADGWTESCLYSDKITLDIRKATNVVLLGCQVTDLAIYASMKYLEKIMKKYPNKNFFVSGCLAQRLDVELPKGIERVRLPYSNATHLSNERKPEWQKPFWISGFKNMPSKKYSDGHTFRYSYPFRVSKGCSFNCSYCTIKHTRGERAACDQGLLIRDPYLRNKSMKDNVVLVADSPSKEEVNWFIDSMLDPKINIHSKGFEIRNVEPRVALECKGSIIKAAKSGMLRLFHAPLQSLDADVLKDMNRNYNNTKNVSSLLSF